MPRIVFVNRFFWPDHSATSQILSDIAFALAARGWSVDIIASRLSYDDPDARLPATQVHEGVRIHRVATTGFGRSNLIGRLIDYASFYVTAWIKAVMLLRRGDVLVVKTDPPMMSIPMRAATALRGARQVNWLQDVYPELAGHLGINAARGPLGRMLAALRNASLRSSAMNVLIGERMATFLAPAKIVPERIAIIHNFTDEQALLPLPAGTSPLRGEWDFAPDDLVIGYSGNLGRAHDIDTILDAAGRLQAGGQIKAKFLFIGGGHLRAELEARAKDLGLTNIVTKPYQPREQLHLSMAVPDIHWLSLRPELEGMIVPSKFYGCAASGRPVLFIGDPQGQIGQMIAASGCGMSVAAGDGAGAAAAITAMADTSMRTAMGQAARQMLDADYRRDQAFDRWDAMLKAITAR